MTVGPPAARCLAAIGVAGGGPGGPGPPPGKISQLGRTKMGSWQDRNGILAGQKWELGRTQMGSLQEVN